MGGLGCGVTHRTGWGGGFPRSGAEGPAPTAPERGNLGVGFEPPINWATASFNRRGAAGAAPRGRPPDTDAREHAPYDITIPQLCNALLLSVPEGALPQEGNTPYCAWRPWRFGGLL